MPQKGWKYGSNLTPDKKGWRYFSPSTLMSADPGTSEGCLRKTFYEKKMGFKPPTTEKQKLGTEIHAQNEHYLLTGERAMGPIAMAGQHMLPKPLIVDPRILVEHEIGGGDLATAPLRAGGVPITGYIDCIHWQEINQGTNDIMDAFDPPGTVEVIDWKTTSDPKWIKSAKEVARTLQMTTYGKWAVEVKGAEYVRLSHGYYVTKGRHAPRKVSLRVHRDEINERWEYVEKLAGSLKEIIKEDDPNRVPANTRACDAYGGCFHKNYCSAYSHDSLASILGPQMAANLLGIEIPPVKTVEDEGNMSLLSKLQTPAKQEVKPDVQAEMKRLALEEVTAKYPGLASAIDEFATLGLGFPTLKGEAERVYVILKEVPSEASGELAQCEFDDPANILAALEEARTIVANRAGTQATVSTSPFPEDAPPALASPPEEKKSEEPSTLADVVNSASAPKKRGRPRKNPEPTPATTQVTTPPVDEIVPQTPAELPKVTVVLTEEPQGQTAQAINLYVDCIPSIAFESFWPIINAATDKIARDFGSKDYRISESRQDLEFGRWKGVLAALIREMNIPGGNYVLDNTMNDTCAVVIEAMREVVARSGGIMVRGIR